MYEALSEIHVPKINQEIQARKSVAEASLNPAKQPSTTAILQKARKLYQEMDVQKKWPDYDSNNGQISQKRL